MQTSRSTDISERCFLHWLGSKWRKQVTANYQHASATLHSAPSQTTSSLYSKCHENLISHTAAFIFSTASTSDGIGTDVVLKLVTCANTSIIIINSRVTNCNTWYKNYFPRIIHLELNLMVTGVTWQLCCGRRCTNGSLKAELLRELA